MIDWIRTYIKFVLLHRWNKISEGHLDFLHEHWKHKPTTGLRLWLYKKIRKINLGNR